jgi:sodium-dependent dicarboxylate transporter 2/3/5
MLATLALFVLPGDRSRGAALLDWPATRDLPWGVLLLVGGGLSLGAIIQSSGLGDWVGATLSGLRAWPLPLTVGAVALSTMAVSHVASNTATAAALTPVAAALAVSIGMSPTPLGVAVALAASCAFMLPVATPPNAIAYGTGLVTTAQMVRAGGLLSAVALAAVILASVLSARTGFGSG